VSGYTLFLGVHLFSYVVSIIAVARHYYLFIARNSDVVEPVPWSVYLVTELNIN